MDAANLLKPALARSQLQLIGATTISEYRKYIEKDAALERRLQPVMCKEPTTAETVEILKAIAESYEKHHKVKYTPESLVAAAKLSERYLTDRFLPDKAIDLMDEAGAIAHLSSYSVTPNVKSIVNDDGSDEDGDEDVPIVDEQTVTEIISEWASIPLGKLESSEMNRLVQLEDDMTLRVKGQQRAIQSVSRAVRRARSGLRDPQRPIASFMFCGPTGTGTWRFLLKIVGCKSSAKETQVLTRTTSNSLSCNCFHFPQVKPSCARHWRKHTMDPKKT